MREHQQFAEVLKQSKDQLQAMIEALPVPLIVSRSSDSKILYANSQASSILGLSLQELFNYKSADFYYNPADYQLLLSQFLQDGYLHNYKVQIKRADGTPFWVMVSYQMLTVNDEAAMLGVLYDITERQYAEESLKVRARQQETVAELGQRALAGVGLATLMNEAVALVAQVLRVKCCGLWEALPGDHVLLLRSGVGWQEGLVGYALVGAQTTSQIGYALLTQQPVIVEDLWVETRFSGPPLLHNHQIVSAVSVIIPGQERPFGVLGVYTTSHRSFSKDDVHFLQAIANVLAAAIERQQAEARLHLMERAIASSNNGIVITDPNQPDNPIIYVNTAFETMTGYQAAELLGRNCRFLRGPKPEQPGLNELRAAILEHRECHVVLQNYRKDGTAFWNELYIAPVFDTDGLLTHFVGILNDITERKRMEDQLVHDAFHDALTGLPNRVLFMDRLRQAIARSQRCSEYLFAVLFLDLDRFKVINDSLGHRVGDQLLVAIAERLENCLRPGDTVARLGGDEFSILLDNIKNITDATNVADRIQQALKLPFNLDGHEVFTTASIGIALSSTGYERPEDLLRDADTAMYRAKENGKSCYAVFDTDMYDRAVTLLQLETDLRWAVERQELRVYYQPIVDLQTSSIKGFEALARWQHPERGLISPEEFIPIAEETGLIGPVGKWILQEACRQLQEWQEQLPSHSSLTISVNLSSKQLGQADLVEQVARILQETGLAPSSLKLEITEGAIVQNPDQAAGILQRLKALGIQLSVDDFGTGYSSLSYLHRFPFDTLKIDRSFIQQIDVDSEQLAIVRAIVTLAANLGMNVVAEGVETTDQLAQLQGLQCEDGQGYFFSKPLNSRAARLLLTTLLQL